MTDRIGVQASGNAKVRIGKLTTRNIDHPVVLTDEATFEGEQLALFDVAELGADDEETDR